MKWRTAVFVLIVILISVSVSMARDVRVLLILPDQYGANFYFNWDDFESFGWDITLTGLTSEVEPCASFAAKVGCRSVSVDTVLSEIADITAYDAVAIMPMDWRSGAAYRDLLASPQALEMLRTAAHAGLAIWATCAGPRVLAALDLVQGRQVVAQDVVRDELIAAGATFLASDHPPVIDGNIITCARGQYYHFQNNDAVREFLEQHLVLPSVGSSEVDCQWQHQQPVDAIWATHFGGTDSEILRAICALPDGGFAVLGTTFSFGQGMCDMLLSKVDSLGELVWSQVFGGEGWEDGLALCTTEDGGLTMVGYTTSTNPNGRDVLLVKTDAQGQLVWQKTFGGSGLEVGTAICETKDHGLALCGFVRSNETAEEDLLVIRTDAAGEMLWQKRIGHERSDRGNAIALTDDGGFLVVGATGSESLSSGNSDFWLLKLTAAGEVERERAYGNHLSSHPFDWAHAFCRTARGNWLLAGDSDVVSPLQAYTIEVNPSGEFIAEKNYGAGFYDKARAIVPARDSGYLLAGSVRNEIKIDNDLQILRLDEMGFEMWSKTFGGAQSDWANALCVAANGDYVIAGQTASQGDGDFDAWVLRLSAMEPNIEASPRSGHAPLTVQFSDRSYGQPTTWQWDLNGDGVFDRFERFPSWTYTEPGYYSVGLQIGDEQTQVIERFDDTIRVFDGESALECNQPTSCALCPATFFPELTDGFTLEAWIYPTGWGMFGEMGFGRIIDRAKYSFFVKGTSATMNDCCLVLQLYTDGGGMGMLATPDCSIKLNRWQHVAACYDATHGQVRMWIDGAEKSLTMLGRVSGAVATHAAQDLLIGNSFSRNSAFQGVIDQVSIWNRVLETPEIQSHLYRYLSGDENGLIGNWDMNEGNGSTLMDHSGQVREMQVEDCLWAQGISELMTGVKKNAKNETSVHRVQLLGNYPNPFNPSTILPFELLETGLVTLTIHDIRGRLVKTLLQDRQLDAGWHEAKWNSQDAQGQTVASGLYFARLVCDGQVLIRKLMRVK
ncbi:DJ-1/PfpI family protein [candidate division KSB1 bacterium]|nr:DJ-1/PfpI family protein [candidate division KSB1 bacterium]